MNYVNFSLIPQKAMFTFLNDKPTEMATPITIDKCNVKHVNLVENFDLKYFTSNKLVF